MKANEIRNEFWQSLPEDLRKQRRSRKSQNDYCADIRCYWVDFTDQLAKSGRITQKQAENIIL